MKDPNLILLTYMWWSVRGGFSQVLGMNFALIVRLGNSGGAEHHVTQLTEFVGVCRDASLKNEEIDLILCYTLQICDTWKEETHADFNDQESLI